MLYKNTFKPITMVATNSNLFGLPYVCLNNLGLPESCAKVIIVNNSNIGFTLSWDSVYAHDFILPNTQREYGIITSDEGNDILCPKFKRGQKFWASAAGAGAGLVYVVGYYVELL